MTDVDKVILGRLTKERERRNEELQSRLAMGRSFEEMLEALASLKGFNKEERARATA